MRLNPEQLKSLHAWRRSVFEVLRPYAHMIVDPPTELPEEWQPPVDVAITIGEAIDWCKHQGSDLPLFALALAVGAALHDDLSLRLGKLEQRASAPPMQPPEPVTCGAVSDKGHLCTGRHGHLGMHFNVNHGVAW